MGCHLLTVSFAWDVSVANGASGGILIAVPRARIVFISLVNVQGDGMHLLHCIKRMARSICPGCPYVVNCVSDIIADTATHLSDYSW